MTLFVLLYLFLAFVALAITMSLGSSIAQIVIGVANINNCPVRSRLPVLLMTPGVCAISGLAVGATVLLVFHKATCLSPKTARIVKIIIIIIVAVIVMAHSILNVIVKLEFKRTFMVPGKGPKVCPDGLSRRTRCETPYVMNPAISDNANNTGSYCSREMFRAAEVTCLIGATCGFVYTIAMIMAAVTLGCKKRDRNRRGMSSSYM